MIASCLVLILISIIYEALKLCQDLIDENRNLLKTRMANDDKSIEMKNHDYKDDNKSSQTDQNYFKYIICLIFFFIKMLNNSMALFIIKKIIMF